MKRRQPFEGKKLRPLSRCWDPKGPLKVTCERAVGGGIFFLWTTVLTNENIRQPLGSENTTHCQRFPQVLGTPEEGSLQESRLFLNLKAKSQGVGTNLYYSSERTLYLLHVWVCVHDQLQLATRYSSGMWGQTENIEQFAHLFVRFVLPHRLLPLT